MVPRYTRLFETYLAGYFKSSFRAVAFGWRVLQVAALAISVWVALSTIESTDKNKKEISTPNVSKTPTMPVMAPSQITGQANTTSKVQDRQEQEPTSFRGKDAGVKEVSESVARDGSKTHSLSGSELTVTTAGQDQEEREPREDIGQGWEGLKNPSDLVTTL